MSSKNTNIINAIQIKKRKSAYGGFELLNGGFDLTNGGFWMIIGGKNGLFLGENGGVLNKYAVENAGKERKKG